MKQLSKLYNIQEGEGKPTVFLFIYSFFFGATLTVGKTARDAYFLHRFDISYLPLMLLAAAMVVGMITIIYNLASKRLPLIQTITLSGFIFAATLLLIQSHLEGLIIPFLYVWIDVITHVISTQLWVYAGMVFNSRQAKRLFSLILCGSCIAIFVIGAIIPAFVGQFGSSFLLSLTAGFILCCVLMAWITRPYLNQELHAQQIQQQSAKSTRILNSYMMRIAIVVSAAAVVTVIIEYQFLIIANQSFPSEEKLASFFGIFYSATGIISLLTQFFIARWILIRFGILTALRILPVGLGMGALAILLGPSLFSVLMARIPEQIIKFTLNKNSFELLWVPVSPEQKQSTKLFIDGAIKTGMQGLTAILIYSLTVMWPLPFPVLMPVLSLMALASIIIWLLTTSYLKNGYVSALMSAIEKRRLDFEKMRLDTDDSDIIRTIDEALNSDEEAIQVFALELIADLHPAPWSKTLNNLFKEGSPSIQEIIVAMTADQPDIVSNAELQAAIEKRRPIARSALISVGKRNIPEMIPMLSRILENPEDQDIDMCAAAATAILLMNNGPCDLAQSTLKALLYSENESYNVIALNMIRHLPDYLTDNQLREFCKSDSTRICSAALGIAAHLRPHESLLPCFIQCLKLPQTRSIARNVLKMYPANEVIGLLNQTLFQPGESTDLKIEIIRALKDYPDFSIINSLAQIVKQSSLPIQSESVDALLHFARQTPLSDDVLQELSSENSKIARHIYSQYQHMECITSENEGLLLRDLYASDIEKHMSLLIKLIALRVPETPVEDYIAHRQNRNSFQMGNLLEVFENILPAMEGGYIIPLFQNMTLNNLCRIGKRYFDDLPTDLDAELLRLIQSQNEYYSIVALDYSISQLRIKVLEQIDWTVFPSQGVHHRIIAQHLGQSGSEFANPPQFPGQHFQTPEKEPHMLSVLEKTIILKDTILFKDVPGEDIYYVAQVMEEERLEKGARLLEEGDKGDYLYIIVTGEILIHIGETELNRHGKGEVIGEMALLDEAPRSTSATALEETLLLKISQENFLDIMMPLREVRKGIMKLLNERIRRLSRRYVEMP